MKTALASILGLGLIALGAGPAAAQGPPRGFGARMGSYSGLLANPSVQKELKLDDKQAEKSKSLEEKMNAEMVEKFQGLGDLEPQERRGKMMEIMHENGTATLKAAGEFLKPEQITRLKQIAHQVRGAQNFSDPDVIKKLKLTDEQKTAMGEIQQESMQERRAIFEEAQGDREVMMKKMGELNKKILEKSEAKLNDEQKKTWKEMTGTPFEIKYE